MPHSLFSAISPSTLSLLRTPFSSPGEPFAFYDARNTAFNDLSAFERHKAARVGVIYSMAEGSETVVLRVDIGKCPYSLGAVPYPYAYFIASILKAFTGLNSTLISLLSLTTVSSRTSPHSPDGRLQSLLVVHMHAVGLKYEVSLLKSCFAGVYMCLSLPVTFPVPRTSTPSLSSVMPTACPPGMSSLSSVLTAAATASLSPPFRETGKKDTAAANKGKIKNLPTFFQNLTSLNIGLRNILSQNLI